MVYRSAFLPAKLLLFVAAWHPGHAKEQCVTEKAATCRPDETVDETELLQHSRVCLQSEANLKIAGGSLQPRRSTSTLQAQVVHVNADTPDFPQPRNRARSALCISGGGSRSLSATLGVFRALEQIGVLPGGFDAISSVSGGTWAAAQYMFATDHKVKFKTEPITDEQLFGPATTPGALTPQALRQATSAIGATATTSFNNAASIEATKTLALCRTNPNCWQKRGATAWVNIISGMMLGPYNLDCGNCYMAGSQQAVDNIIASNPSLQKGKWTVPRTNRPKTFVMSSTLLGPVDYSASLRNAVSFQMSPDYIGPPFYPNGTAVDYKPCVLSSGQPLADVLIGGGLIESFAFGGSSSDLDGGGFKEVQTPSTPFTLSLALASSSSSFAGAASCTSVSQIVTPKTPYQAIPDEAHAQQEERTWQLGDGWSIENLGLLAMMQSGATKLAVLINTVSPLANTSELNLCDIPAGTDLSESTSASASSNLGCVFGYCTEPGADNFFGNNQVFVHDDYGPLLCELQKLRDAGKPAIASQSLTTVQNTWWNIQEGLEVDVVWVYLERIADFEDQLPEQTKAEIQKGPQGDFANYPFYKTTLNNPLELTALTMSQVNLLAAHFEYAG